MAVFQSLPFSLLFLFSSVDFVWDGTGWDGMALSRWVLASWSVCAIDTKYDRKARLYKQMYYIIHTILSPQNFTGYCELVNSGRFDKVWFDFMVSID